MSNAANTPEMPPSAVFTCGHSPLTSRSVAQAPRVIDTFTCTGGEQTWTVPAGVSQATFVVEGASGGVLGDISPGLGGRAEATVAVTPGTVYTVVVGCQGQKSGGYRPGVPPARGGFGFGQGGDGGPSDSTSSIGASAGGGGSAVLLGTDVILVGGGGGGTASGGDPGAGGGTTGGAGGPTTDTGGGGGAGTATGPGAGGQVPAGTHGSAGTGHDGGSGSAAAGKDNHGGGGGGGGWFGGGGGGSGDRSNRRWWRCVRLRRTRPLRDADPGHAQRGRPGDDHPRGNLISTRAAGAPESTPGGLTPNPSRKRRVAPARRRRVSRRMPTIGAGCPRCCRTLYKPALLRDRKRLFVPVGGTGIEPVASSVSTLSAAQVSASDQAIPRRTRRSTALLTGRVVVSVIVT